jgi:hypothetical protein
MGNNDSTHAQATPPDRYRQVLGQFVQTVDATGGVFRDESGCHAPLADPDWIDLGEAYVEACAALGRDIILAETPWTDVVESEDSQSE